jgi:hypothetical protein
MDNDIPDGAAVEPERGPEPATAAAAPPAARKKHFRRTRALFGRITRTKKGIVGLIGAAMLVTAAVVGGAMWFIPYSESVAFCTTCHTMIPQHKAFDVSAHSEVACGHCHVAPGVQGWVKAKWGGMKELTALVTNTYPTPIPPIPHEELPDPEVTCMECHSLDRINTPGNPIKLILRPRYELDRQNTMQQVAVAIRPTGLGSTRSATSDTTEVETSSGEQAVLDPRGVHWHVAEDLTVYATDEGTQTIPLVEYTNENGRVESFISAAEIGMANDVTPDIQRLKAKTFEYEMNCYDCHNMVGHNIPDPSRVLDDSMAEGAISPTLPFIKRDSLALLNRPFPSEEEASQAIEEFGATYAEAHPDAAAEDPEAIPRAVEELQRIYSMTATPAMNTVWTTYPDNLGHQRSPGCFRCHDGTHVKVVDGVATDQVIPSTCSTCHTFPQVGQDITGLQLGVPPASHADKLYVFSHKDTVPSVDAVFAANPPANADCATCHQKSYCENCHNSGAVNVNHDEMLYNHAESVRKSSLTACAYCHQPVYCATCHTEEITSKMTLSQARLNSQGDAPEGTATGSATPEGDATTE